MGTRLNQLYFWLGSLITAAGVFCLVFFIKADYSLIGWMNALAIAGVSVAGAGVLLLVYKWGAFDMLVYGFRDLFWHMNPSRAKVAKYDDDGDYREKKKEYRSANKLPIWVIFAVGGAFVVASLVCRLVLFANTGY